MIHIGAVREVLTKQEPFSLKFFKKNGELVEAENVVCTSTFFQNDTANILFIDSRQVRKIHVSAIIELNGEEVCL